MKKNLLLILIGLVITTGLVAQTATAPTAGDGSESSPWEIATSDNLYWLTQNSGNWSDYFIQTADLDVSAFTSDYSPIGTSGTKFTGNYDGQGHSVTGCYYNDDGNDYIGLFGYANGATITNVGTIDAYFFGDDYVGGLVGYAYNTTVSNCFAVNATVIGHDDYIGGLVGYNYNGSSIDNCFSTGSVRSDGDSTSDYQGGLVGRNRSSATITNCYSYASVDGVENVGGLLGSNSTASIVENCYAMGAVSASVGNIGGLVGSNYNTITNSYYCSETSGQSDTGRGEPLPELDFIKEASFNGWDFTSTWQIDEEISFPGLLAVTDAVVITPMIDGIASLNNEYTQKLGVSAVDGQPHTTELLNFPTGMTLSGDVVTWTPTEAGSFTVEYKLTTSYGIESTSSYSITVVTLSGAGTEANPFLISSLDDLLYLYDNQGLWSYYVAQTANINAAVTRTWNEGEGFSPIGAESLKFTGSYNGQGFSIDSLYINRPTTDYVGLFGYTDGATLKNLALSNCDITGNNYVGTLVGRSDYEAVSNTYASGSVFAYGSYVGGLFGKTYQGNVTNCYATTKVEGVNSVGGFVGETKSALSFCYATGLVVGEGNTGGFAGTMSGSAASTTDCYYIAEASGQDDTGKGESKPLAEMMQSANFSTWTEWDITDGVTLPRLKAVVDGPVLLQTVSEFIKTGVEHNDALTVIGMDNETVSLELVQNPEGMVLTDNVIIWTPTAAGIYTVEIKATDASGLVNSYVYYLTTTSFVGDGTETDPYEVASSNDLVELSEVTSLWDAYFVQTADIDAASVSNFVGIGTSDIAFEGSYKGKGYTISNLTISSEENYAGLFGYISGASIDSLSLNNCSVTGDEYVGILAGYAESSSISYCSSTGSVSSEKLQSKYIGGLLGYISATPVAHSNSRATVSGFQNAGGLIGYNIASTVSVCYANGDVKGASYIDMDTYTSYLATNVGGLIGFNDCENLDDAVVVEYCYASGAVSNAMYIGGLIGNNDGGYSVSNCYATGNVYALEDAYTYKSNAGGLIGTYATHMTSAGNCYLTNCYSLGLVYGPNGTIDTDINGLLGVSSTPLTTTNCYYNSETSDCDDDINRNGDPLTTAEMLLATSYVDWDFDGTWTMAEGLYPVLDTIANHAPFAFIDSVDVAGSIYLLANDYDFESGQSNLVYEITDQPIWGTVTNGYYSFKADQAVGKRDSLRYRVGEVTALGDIIWGSGVESFFTKIENTAPVLTSAIDTNLYENTSITLSMRDVTASDVNNDSLSLVIAEGDNYIFDGTIVTPTLGFYGDLAVNISVYDGELSSNSIVMNVTVIAVPNNTVLTWPVPDAITYGAPAGKGIMNASTDAPGTFAYSFTADSVFNVGDFELYTEFTPTNELDFTMVSSTVNYSVTKADLIAKADNYTITVAEAIPDFTISYSGLANNDTEDDLDIAPTATSLATADSPIGEYAIIVSGGNDNNYELTYVTGTLTITDKIVPAITWEAPASTVYGLAIGSSAMSASTTVEGTYAYSFASDSVFSAGTYDLTVNFTPTDVDKYSSNQVTVEYVVTKAPLTATANDITIKVGYEIPELTINYSGLVNDEKIDIVDALPIAATTATSLSEVGEYAITLSGGLDANYEIINIDGTLTITNKIVPEITWESPASSVYGSAIGDAAMSASSLTEGTFSYSFKADSIFNAGTYQVIVEFTPKNTADYAVVNKSVEYIVSKLTLTATADNFTITVDAAIPVYTISYTGFALNETESVIDVYPTATSIATEESTVGNYVIIASGGSDNNYKFTFVNGTLTITDKTVSELTWEAPASTVYGSAIGTSAMSAQTSVDGSFAYSFKADSIFNAGTYKLTAVFTPTDNIQFETNQITVEYSVTKAQITATADDITILYGEAIPELTINYSGFANDETSSVLDAVPTAITAASSSSAIGSYDIIVFGGFDNNYEFTTVNGTLNITDKAIPEITWESPASSVYGIAIGDAAMDASASIDGTFAYSFAADSIFNAGTYQLRVDFTPNNTNDYASVNKSVEYIVKKATLTVTAANDSIKEGDAIPELMFSYSGFVNNDTEDVLDVVPTSTTTADATSAIGTYYIVVSGGSDNNYTFTYISGTLTIYDGVGVNNQDASAISVYPNPAISVVNITNVANTKVEIFDITGQLIFTEDVISEVKQINVSDFKAGIYIINIINDKDAVSKRFIIE